MNQKFVTALEILLIVGLIGLVLYWGGLFHSPPNPTPTGPATSATPTPMPSPSPVPMTEPTGLIAFSSSRDGNFEIYVMEADGRNQRNLTQHSALDNSPLWSPDGKRIAFTSDRTGWPEIYVMQADGSALKQITAAQELNAIYMGLAWSPESNFIAAVQAIGSNPRTPSPTTLELIQIDDTHHTQLYSIEASFFEPPHWSPDGRRLAVAIDLRETKIFSLEAINNTPLTVEKCSVVDWLPDGKQILCLVDNSIVLVNLETMSRTTLSDSFYGATGVQLSPDGQYLLYGTGALTIDQGVAYFEYTLFPFHSPQPQTTLRLPQAVRAADWASDGQWLTYTVADDSLSSDIGILNIYDPSHLRLLTRNAGFNFQSQWQP